MKYRIFISILFLPIFPTLILYSLLTINFNSTLIQKCRRKKQQLFIDESSLDFVQLALILEVIPNFSSGVYLS